MPFQLIYKEKYKLWGWTDLAAEEDRRENCMCLNCKHMQICPAAMAFFALCKHFGNSVKMTFCPVSRDPLKPNGPDNVLFEPKDKSKLLNA